MLLSPAIKKPSELPGRMRAVYLLILLLPSLAFGQTANPYFLNGNATQDDCNCYTLTPDALDQAGSVWNINRIDLRQSFTFSFNVFLGCADAAGADGIAFMLQPISTSVGSSGGGLGFEGVRPSVAVTLDTWQNVETGQNHNDPDYDHIAIQANGVLDHNTPNNLSGPIPMLTYSPNAEDCNWHVLKITWDAANKLMTTWVDGTRRAEVYLDIVAKIFNGNPLVYWGFTGSTGGAKNLQRFCTSLNPKFYLPANTSTCYPEPVIFKDSSVSFGTIDKWFWDFGDGTKYLGQNPPPHVFPVAGEYNVKLNIVGNDGCLSDTFRSKVIAGSKPVAELMEQQPVQCEGVPLTFNAQTRVNFGTVNQWAWTLDGMPVGDSSTLQVVLPAGTHVLQLDVATREGCIAQPAIKTIDVKPRPQIEATTPNGCAGIGTLFTANTLNGSVPVADYTWQIGSLVRKGSRISYSAPAKGRYNVSVYGIGENGCQSDTIKTIVDMDETKANAGPDIIAASNTPIQLNGSGGDFYEWLPAFGLNDASIANPVATLQQQQTYRLKTTTINGCATYDDITVKVFEGPAVYVPNAFTPNADGRNDKLRFYAVGYTIQSFRIYNRYGQVVYSNPDMLQGWDGRFKGVPQLAGAFVWQIEALNVDGKRQIFKGTFVLIR